MVMIGGLPQHRQGQGALIHPERNFPICHRYHFRRRHLQGLEVGKVAGRGAAASAFGAGQGLGRFIHHQHHRPIKPQALVLGEALKDDLQEPLLLHRGQHDLRDLLQGGEIPDHALVFLRQVLNLLIGEGIFDGVDDDAGHGEEKLAVFRVEGQVFAVGVEFVIHPQGAGQLPLEGERHRQAVMGVAGRIR